MESLPVVEKRHVPGLFSAEHGSLFSLRWLLEEFLGMKNTEFEFSDDSRLFAPCLA